MQETTGASFEQAFQELETVVKQLEGGDLSLEQTLALFERGMVLAKLCESKLDEAEQKVTQLSAAGSEGPVLTPFRVEK